MLSNRPTSIGSKPLLRVQNLSARIGRQAVLSNISLAINESECVAIVGGSGAGKSCLLRCLMGLHSPAKPYAGSLTFLNQTHAFDEKPSANRQSHLGLEAISFVPQNPQAGLDPLKRLSVQWQQALRCAGQSSMSQTDQRALLDSLNLKPFGRDYPHQWSQGMQQRLLIAFALASKPKLLILDEPTSALDPIIASATMLSIMDYANRHHASVLMVTHDLALASRFAQNVAIMSHGCIEEFGSAESLLTSPQSEYGKLLVAHRDWQTGKLHAQS